MEDGNSPLPRSMRHKQVLDVAEEHPNASFEELASMVPSATADLVEHIFAEYGDPADDSFGAAADAETSTPESAERTATEQTPDQPSGQESVDGQSKDMPDTTSDDAEQTSQLPAVDELTEKQIAVLQLIRETPAATQRELGGKLGVSAAAVSTRVNGIDGFDWSDRLDCATAILPDEAEPVVSRPAESSAPQAGEADTDTQVESTEGTAIKSDGGQMTTETATPDETGADTEVDLSSNGANDQEQALDGTIAELCERVTELENRLDERTETGSPSVEQPSEAVNLFDDPALVQKVAHACLCDDAITETEERQILQALLA